MIRLLIPSIGPTFRKKMYWAHQFFFKIIPNSPLNTNSNLITFLVKLMSCHHPNGPNPKVPHCSCLCVFLPK